MKFEERPIKREYYIGYYDIEKSIDNRLAEEYFTTKNEDKFRARLIEMLQDDNYIIHTTFEAVYYEGNVYLYDLHKIEEKIKRIIHPSIFEKWKKANNIGAEKYVFQPEVDI